MSQAKWQVRSGWRVRRRRRWLRTPLITSAARHEEDSCSQGTFRARWGRIWLPSMCQSGSAGLGTYKATTGARREPSEKPAFAAIARPARCPSCSRSAWQVAQVFRPGSEPHPPWRYSCAVSRLHHGQLEVGTRRFRMTCLEKRLGHALPHHCGFQFTGRRLPSDYRISPRAVGWAIADSAAMLSRRSDQCGVCRLRHAWRGPGPATRV